MAARIYLRESRMVLTSGWLYVDAAGTAAWTSRRREVRSVSHTSSRACNDDNQFVEVDGCGEAGLEACERWAAERGVGRICSHAFVIA